MRSKYISDKTSPMHQTIKYGNLTHVIEKPCLNIFVIDKAAEVTSLTNSIIYNVWAAGILQII